MKRTNIMLDDDQHRSLKAYARKEGRTIGGLVREAIDTTYGAKDSLVLRREAALNAYKEGLISLGKLAEILGLDPISARFYLRERNIQLLVQSVSEIRRDARPDDSELERAIQIALRAHAGQKDKAGAPYIIHPLRVMLKMNTELERATAVLHDVVEDGGVTIGDLKKAGISADVIEAVDCLSRRDGESYEDFILRLKPNALARRVKTADLEDNMDLSRLKKVTREDRERLVKYKKARTVLSD